MAQSIWCRSLPSDRVMPCRAPDPSSGRPGRCRVCAADSWFQPQQAGQAVPRAERQVCCFPGAGPQMHHAAQRRRRRSLGGCSDPGDGGEEHLRLWATPPDGEGVPRLARPAWLRLAHRLAQPPRPGPPTPPRRSKPALGSHAHAHTASMPPRRAAVATHPATRGCCRGGHSAYLETLREAAAAEGVEFYYYKGTSPLQRADKALFDLARASTPSTASGPCSSGISPSSPTTHT